MIEGAIRNHGKTVTDVVAKRCGDAGVGVMYSGVWCGLVMHMG